MMNEYQEITVENPNISTKNKDEFLIDEEEKSLEMRVAVDLDNLDELCQCAICMEEYDMTNKKLTPVTGLCGCKTMVCLNCFTTILKSKNDSTRITIETSYSTYASDPLYSSKICPTCRKSTRFTPVNDKVVIILNELINMKNNIKEYIQLHSDCETSKKLINNLINIEAKDEMTKMTLESLSKLMLDLVDRSCAMERETKKNNYSKIKKITQKESTLVSYEQMLAEKERKLHEFEDDLNKRDKELCNLEQERENIKTTQETLDELVNKNNTYKNKLDEDMYLMQQNQELFESREKQLTESEKNLKQSELNHNDMSQILEMEVRQLFEDKEIFEKERALFDEEKQIFEMDKGYPIFNERMNNIEADHAQICEDALKLIARINNINNKITNKPCKSLHKLKQQVNDVKNTITQKPVKTEKPASIYPMPVKKNIFIVDEASIREDLKIS